MATGQLIGSALSRTSTHTVTQCK